MQPKPPKRQSGRPHGSKTDYNAMSMRELHMMLRGISARVQKLDWIEDLVKKLGAEQGLSEARSVIYGDSCDLRVIVPALTPILTAHMEVTQERPMLDIEELIKLAGTAALPPALPAPSRPSDALTPVGVLKADDE